MPLTIVFNGTSDTYYPTDQSYLVANKLTGIGEGSHTLSFFADCIAISAEQIIEPLFSKISKKDLGLLIVQNELVVINGADDLGHGVHNLIVTGLMAALNAIMRGERNINFVGFSRGSVEAIHMTHELQRIKDYLSNPTKDHSAEAIVKFISDDCYNPSGVYYFGTWRTNRIYEYYLTALQTTLHHPENLQALKNGLGNPDLELRFNGMLLDPVPGLTEGSSLLYIPWKSPHHTVIAAMVDELTVAYMNDELSAGFRAVWVESKPESKTKVNHFHLPGYHGTANGNPVNHEPEKALSTSAPFPYQNLRGVQKLYFYKLLQFAHKHGIRFKSPEQLAGRFLTPVFEHFITNQDNLTAQNEFIRAQYLEIAQHLADYRKTRETYYIPNLRVAGGLEHMDHERILMTKSGERSLSDCFSFSTIHATTYINFDSFSLDFMSLLFPEHLSAPADSPVYPALTYSGVHDAVLQRYASPSPETDCSALLKKIKGLLAACHSHHLDHELNKIILNVELDQKGILSNLLTLVPAKLADSFFSTMNESDKQSLQEVITQIISFQLTPLSEQEATEEAYSNLLRIKNIYLDKFKTAMQEALISQTHKTALNLLADQEKLNQRAMLAVDSITPDIMTSTHEESKETGAESSFDTWDYLLEAERLYQALIDYRAKLQFSGSYLSAELYQDLQYKIEEKIAQFPLQCERVLQKHQVLWQEAMGDLSVMLPMREKRLLQTNLEHAQNANSLLRQQNRDLYGANAELRTAKATLQTQLQSNQQSNEEQQTSISSLQTQLHDIQQQSIDQQTLINSLQTNIQTIRDTLFAHQTAQYSGFTLQVIGNLGILLGTLLAAISMTYLVLGTAGVAVPLCGAVAGAALTSFGIFCFGVGSKRQRDQALAEHCFPAGPN